MKEKIVIEYEIDNQFKNDVINTVKVTLIKLAVINLLIQIPIFLNTQIVSILLYLFSLIITLIFIFIDKIYYYQFKVRNNIKQNIIIDDKIIVNNNKVIEFNEIKEIYKSNNIYCFKTNKMSLFIPIDFDRKETIEKKINNIKIKDISNINVSILYIFEILLVILHGLKLLLIIK